METLKAGVIGVGSMGRHHARVYSEMHNVELAGVADINPKNREYIRSRYGIECYNDYNELLSKNLDAVSIAVPTTLHKKIALLSLSKGVNVLLEKPIADTVKNARDIIKKSEEKGLKLMVGHVERFNPIVPVIKNRIKNMNTILINITRVGPLPPRIKDVGVMIDLGVHDIDLIKYLTNSEFKNMFPIVSSNITEKEDTAIVSFEMKNGTLAHILVDWLTPYKVRKIEILTKDNFITGDFISQKVVEYSRYKEDGSYIVNNLAVPLGEPLKLEIESFVDCIINDKPPRVTGYDGLDALKVALNCIRISKRL